MEENKQKLEPKYGLFMAVSMVIGQVIGSGIFFKVDDVLLATNGDIYAGFLGFLIVGISVVFAGISMANYAELLPKEGGILNYVEYRFGKTAAAYVGWVYFSMFFPLLTGVLLTVSGIYIANFLALFNHFEPNFLHYSLIGLLNGVLFFVLNIFRPNYSGIFQQLTTVLKLLPLILISALGIISFFNGDSEILTSSEKVVQTSENTNFWLLVAASFIPISFSMDGWYVALQISGEVKDSKKNMPRALMIGTMIVLLVYVFYYLGIVSQLNVDEISVLKDNYITEFARRVGSEGGAIVMQLFIIISVLGTCNGLMLASTRVPYQFYHLEKSKKFWNLGKVDDKTKMPLNSAFVAFGLIVFYLVIFYLTNTLDFFLSKGYDISAIPIIFIYIVNFCLFIGLFKLLNEGKFKGNKWLKSTMLIFAILGTLLVVGGSVLAPNGLSYFIIALVIVSFGRLVVEK